MRLVILASLLCAGAALAQVDPADAAASAVAAIPAPAPMDASLLLVLAAAFGVLLRAVVVPLLKVAPITGRIFKGVPLPVQHLLIVVLAAAAAGLEAYGSGRGPLEALSAAMAAYLASQAAFHGTKNSFEHRGRGQ